MAGSIRALFLVPVLAGAGVQAQRCDLAMLQSHLAVVQVECCSGGEGLDSSGESNHGQATCTSGYPAATDTCSRECARAIQPFWEDCGALLQALRLGGTEGMAQFHATCAARPSCDLSLLFEHLQSMQLACCAAGGSCAAGNPGASDECSMECALVFEPFWDDCGTVIMATMGALMGGMDGMPTFYNTCLATRYPPGKCSDECSARTLHCREMEVQNACCGDAGNCPASSVTPLECPVGCALFFPSLLTDCEASLQLSDDDMAQYHMFSDRCLAQDAVAVVEYAQDLLRQGCDIDLVPETGRRMQDGCELTCDAPIVLNQLPGVTATAGPGVNDRGNPNEVVDMNHSPGAWTSSPTADLSTFDAQVYMTIDLGGPQTTTGARIWHYYGNDRAYCSQKLALSLTGSFNGEETIVFDTGDACGPTESVDGVMFDWAPFSGRYLRHWSGRSTSNSGIHFLEIDVYGCAGESCAPPPPRAPPPPTPAVAYTGDNTGMAKPLQTDPNVCSWDSFDDRVIEVSASCCEGDADRTCPDGALPRTCSPVCAVIYHSFFQDCGRLLAALMATQIDAFTEFDGACLASADVQFFLSAIQHTTCCITSCRHAPGPTGVYRMCGRDGAEDYNVYCDMDTDGGGWTMVMNINPVDDNLVGYGQDFWTGEHEYGEWEHHFANDYKSPAAYQLNDQDRNSNDVPTTEDGEIMIQSIAYPDSETDAAFEDAEIRGWRTWPMLPEFPSFHSMFSTECCNGDNCGNGPHYCKTGDPSGREVGTTDEWDDIIRRGTCLRTDLRYGSSNGGEAFRLMTYDPNSENNHMGGFGGAINSGNDLCASQGIFGQRDNAGMDRVLCNADRGTACDSGEVRVMRNPVTGAPEPCQQSQHSDYCTSTSNYHYNDPSSFRPGWTSRFFVREPRELTPQEITAKARCEAAGRYWTGSECTDLVSGWHLADLYTSCSDTCALFGQCTCTDRDWGVHDESSLRTALEAAGVDVGATCRGFTGHDSVEYPGILFTTGDANCKWTTTTNADCDHHDDTHQRLCYCDC